MLRRCALAPGDTVAVLSESQSRPVLRELSLLAAARLGCRVFSVSVPSTFEKQDPVARSTGASTALQNLAPVVAALANAIDDAIGVRFRQLPLTPSVLERQLLNLDECEQQRCRL